MIMEFYILHEQFVCFSLKTLISVCDALLFIFFSIASCIVLIKFIAEIGAHGDIVKKMKKHEQSDDQSGFKQSSRLNKFIWKRKRVKLLHYEPASQFTD